MQIYPAIDLRDGQCVRLFKGDFAQQTTYAKDPVKQACRFADAGAEWLHIVDLDGAKARSPQQTGLIALIAAETGLSIQAGGGVRSAEDIETLLAAGVDRVVVGSLLAKNPDLAAELISRFGADRITLALDMNKSEGQFFIATEAWQETSGLSLNKACREFEARKVKHILMTDTSRDGVLAGINGALYEEVSENFPGFALQASGGVATLADIRVAKTAGAKGLVIGKALYEGVFTLEEALAAAKGSKC